MITTLCYIEKDNKYLMLHRVKKKDDLNEGKWIGVGGKLEKGESPEECVVREVKEETGLTLTDYRFRGLITFLSDDGYSEYMCLFTASQFYGELKECSEGTLEWINKKDVLSLNLWEGDRVFLKLLDERADFFSLKLTYQGEKLTECYLDGKEIILHNIANVY